LLASLAFLSPAPQAFAAIREGATLHIHVLNALEGGGEGTAHDRTVHAMRQHYPLLLRGRGGWHGFILAEPRDASKVFCIFRQFVTTTEHLNKIA
jgi:hypothetical protein